MTEKTNKVPGIAIINIAGGLLLMAFFTIIWSIIAENEMNGNDNGVVLIAFGLFSLTFIIYALYLFSISKRFPTLSNDAQKLEGKKFAKKFGIFFAIEGIAIFVLVNILINFHCDIFVIPAIALIVGLHFYPMARIFKRKIDYYFATWTCLIALSGMVMLIMKSLSIAAILAFVSISVALATSGYGIYMLHSGRQLTKNE
jgi:hypothetical protein